MDSSPKSPKVSLPSIHEMFPEHMMTKKNEGAQSPTPSTIPSPKRRTRPSPTPSAAPSDPSNNAISFDVLRSDPSSSSLQHLGSSTSLPTRNNAAPGSTGFYGSAYPTQQKPQQSSFRLSTGGGGSASPSPPSASDASSSSSSPSSSGSSDASSASSATSVEDTLSPASRPAESPYLKDASAPPPKSSSTPPAVITFPAESSAQGEDAMQVDEAGAGSEDDDMDGGNGTATAGSTTGEGQNGTKKHVCPTCLKRFNRPSSLRIHVNTHTGATPFRCPWPNCGREFNVNSNMRRHYRNHTTPGFAHGATSVFSSRPPTIPPTASSSTPHSSLLVHEHPSSSSAHHTGAAHHHAQGAARGSELIIHPHEAGPRRRRRRIDDGGIDPRLAGMPRTLPHGHGLPGYPQSVAAFGTAPPPPPSAPHAHHHERYSETHQPQEGPTHPHGHQPPYGHHQGKPVPTLRKVVDDYESGSGSEEEEEGYGSDPHARYYRGSRRSRRMRSVSRSRERYERGAVYEASHRGGGYEYGHAPPTGSARGYEGRPRAYSSVGPQRPHHYQHPAPPPHHRGRGYDSYEYEYDYDYEYERRRKVVGYEDAYERRAPPHHLSSSVPSSYQHPPAYHHAHHPATHSPRHHPYALAPGSRRSPPPSHIRRGRSLSSEGADSRDASRMGSRSPSPPPRGVRYVESERAPEKGVPGYSPSQAYVGEVLKAQRVSTVLRPAFAT